MPCCEQNIVTFVEALTTTIPYYGEYGDEPQVDVSYLIDGVWQQAGVFTSISRTPTTITVDHGGAGTGAIRVS
jgi:hypothetical protein